MARWEGNARGRLERAALDLFTEQGYDRTTVAEIARRAGLTERSFYRWFSDKREVLFAGDELARRFVDELATVPPGTAPLPALLSAFEVAPQVFRPREFLRERSTVIAANPPLQERELIKLATMADLLTSALVGRGEPEQAARLAVDVSTAVLRLASERWFAADDADPTDFRELLGEAADELLAVTATAAALRTDPAR